MSTSTAVRPAAAGSMPGAGISFSRVLRSEWIKFWSVRSTRWSLLAAVLVTVGFGVLISWGVSTDYSHESLTERLTVDPTGISLTGLAFGQLAGAVLGVLIISSEYSTGGIRATLTAVPRRLTVLAAKAVVIAAVTLVVGILTCFVAFFLGQLFFVHLHIDAHLGDPGVLRAVIGGGFYLAGSTLFGFAFGVLLRHSAGAITAAVALLLVAPPLTGLLPGDWGDAVNRYFTSNAGGQISSTLHTPNTLGPWTGYAVFTAEWAVVLVVAAFLMLRRDA